MRGFHHITYLFLLLSIEIQISNSNAVFVKKSLPSINSFPRNSEVQKYPVATEEPKLPSYTTIFPVYPKELAKFFSLGTMMFWIIYVFSVTRDTKDTLIVITCGAEAIAFLKVLYLNNPC